MEREIDPDEILVFFRGNGWVYSVDAVKGIDLTTQARDHAELNPGTLRVEDKRGSVLWCLQ